MRSEKEILELIISTAAGDERIRAAYLGGSRTNPQAPRDIFQDYDVMYIVSETRSFREDAAWIDRFGERLYMQYPEDSPFFPSDVDACYGWLMQFCDGVRIDLHVAVAEHALRSLEAEGMYRVLLDKDGLLPETDRETERSFFIKPLTEREFLALCNEFWWCTNNAAKGLWRGELSYTMDMVNLHIRPQLLSILEQLAGLDRGFSVSAGKSGKYLPLYLPEGLWARYLGSFSPAVADSMWAALLDMCALMDECARRAAEASGFFYDADEAESAMLYLRHVRALPKDAKGVF